MPTREPRRPTRTRVGARAAGLATSAALALVATVLGHLVPVVGAPVFAIVGGILIVLTRPLPDAWRPGVHVAAKSVLQGSIVVLGTALSFREVLATGARSLPVMVGSLAVALAGAALVGRALGITRDLRTLIGVGTGICGASAIAATDAVIEAPEADVTYAVATIFLFNVAAVLSFPTLGRLLHMTPGAFGLWAGTAVNDMSSVVAAASIFGHGAASSAVVVKLTRTLMIIPITLVLALWRARGAPRGERRSLLGHVRKTFPVFIAWFVLATTLNTLGLVPRGLHAGLGDLAQFMITMALGAIGLSTRVRDIARAGLRPLLLGAILWILVGSVSLGLQSLSGLR
ncbi:MAG: putative sulfate exporter family transporter [Acidobacteriota bacterium]|nr:putative sulfate exporter family transporter [Acidobacteriota bacterium]